MAQRWLRWESYLEHLEQGHQHLGRAKIQLGSCPGHQEQGLGHQHLELVRNRWESFLGRPEQEHLGQENQRLEQGHLGQEQLSYLEHLERHRLVHQMGQR